MLQNLNLNYQSFLSHPSILGIYIVIPTITSLSILGIYIVIPTITSLSYLVSPAVPSPCGACPFRPCSCPYSWNCSGGGQVGVDPCYGSGNRSGNGRQ